MKDVSVSIGNKNVLHDLNLSLKLEKSMQLWEVPEQENQH